MNGQNGWYAGQQPQYPPYSAPQQQQQVFQGEAQQRPRPGQQQQAYMHNASTSYHSGHAMGLAQPPYPAISPSNQSLDRRYATGFNEGAASSPASVAYPQSISGPYNPSQAAQPSPSAQYSHAVPVRESASSSAGNGFVQLHGAGQRAHDSQYHHHQQYIGGQLQRSSLDYGNIASPVQHRFQPSAGPSQQAVAQQSFASPSTHSTPRHHQLQPPRADSSQYPYESPYAPSTGTRERLAMSQSPMSDAFQSGAQPAGRTFNLMADFGTPTPNPPLRHPSVQTNFEGSFDHLSAKSAAQSTQTAEPFSSHQWHSPSNNSAPQLASWPVVQGDMQSAAPISSLASWNQSKPYSDMHGSSAQSHRNPSFDR
ncbi:uncharacterized protein SPSC_02178 [Sporisorium scitamineum]|uniref:Uncharacterized protein n=1 Tax=Sporisorium scitamineum TaxID=49012 RepID=A0A0F7SBB0_9BASI|nr:uncharacterized protein SPSC_02178 [Sporisorium scitamineum]CDW99701.1 hypothetical protein [Sporisorium scitamineum]